MGARARMSLRRRIGFWAGLAAGAALAALLWLLLLAGQLGRPTASNAWISQAYDYKLALAERIDEPKLVIVAGSNALFGLDSALLEKALGRPVVNLGVNAGIQSSFILAYARRVARPGDWVLLPVEYPMFHDRHRVGYAFLDYLLSHPSYRSIDLSLPQLAQVAWQTPLARVWEGYRGLPSGFAVNGLYGAHHMDGRGDQTHSEQARQEIWMREGVERAALPRYGALAAPYQASWAVWRAFAAEVARAGGCAIFIPSVMLDRAALHAGVERDYYEGLPAQARAQGLDYRGEPFAFMYPIDHFFDTDFHLTAEARVVHTERVAALVAPAFEGCAPGSL